MTGKKTFTEIMENPRRVECEGRFIKFGDQLAAEGYNWRDIAHAALHAARHAAMQDGMPFFLTFLRHMATAADMSVQVGLNLVDRLGEIKKNAN